MFIVIEGLDASGKGTQSKILEDKLKQAGHSVYGVSLPNYDDDSSALVKMYLAGQFGSKPDDVNAFASSAFYAVDRYASYKKTWQYHIENTDFVIANRYTTSNCCHQMTKLPKENWDFFMQWLYDFEYVKLGIPKPDLVIFLDMPVEVSQKLLMHRYEGDETKKDLHEADIKYLYACSQTAHYAAKKDNWSVIPCAADGEPRSIEAISKDVMLCINNFLAKKVTQ